jgi:hypothetical protein
MLKRTTIGSMLYSDLCDLRYNPCYVERYYLSYMDYGYGLILYHLNNQQQYNNYYMGNNNVKVIHSSVFIDSILPGLRAALSAPKSRKASLALRDCAEQIAINYFEKKEAA